MNYNNRSYINPTGVAGLTNYAYVEPTRHLEDSDLDYSTYNFNLKLDDCKIGYNHESLYKLVTENSTAEGVKPIFLFTERAWQRLRYYTRAVYKMHKAETCGYFLYKKIHPNAPVFLIFEAFVVPQHVSAGEAEILETETNRMIEALAPQVLKTVWENSIDDFYLPKPSTIHDILGHWHSHGSMGAFWSGTDQTQQRNTAGCGWKSIYRPYVVMNVSDQIKGNLVTYHPILGEKEAVIKAAYTKLRFTSEDAALADKELGLCLRK